MSAVLEALSSLPRFGTGIGLARCSRLLDALDINPVSTVGITGSNGKGSTAAMTAALLTGAGIRTGLFTSPHFLDPTERFQIEGIPVSLELVEHVASEVMSMARSIQSSCGESFSRFELLTVMAWKIFQLEKIEAFVIEAGIGGRFDPTRLGQPSITAVTSLDLEHTELLGNSLELIFSDKVELTQRGGTCFTALPADRELQRHCSAYAHLASIHIRDLDEFWPELRYSEVQGKAYLHGSDPKGTRIDIQLPLNGPWQARNAGLAIACAEEALVRLHRPVPPDRRSSWITQSFSSVRVAGRLEKVHDDPVVIVDAAHTPDAIKQLVEYLRENAPKDSVMLVGISANKPFRKMAALLSQLPFPAFVSASDHGGADPGEISAILEREGATVADVGNDLPSIVASAIQFARDRNSPLYVLGGIFFPADVCRVLNPELPKALYL